MKDRDIRPVDPEVDTTAIHNQEHSSAEPRDILHVPFYRRPWPWVILAGILFLVLVSLAALAAKERRSEYQGGDMMSLHSSHEAMYDSMTQKRALKTNGTLITGVVTVVTADGFTVAGNGTTKEVRTNTSTTYNTSAKKVSVNDTVRVDGITSGGAFTANNVAIINQ